MNDTEKIGEWTRYYQVCFRKMNALVACLETDGERTLTQVLQKLGLGSASDVVKACKEDHKRSMW